MSCTENLDIYLFLFDEDITSIKKRRHFNEFSLTFQTISYIAVLLTADKWKGYASRSATQEHKHLLTTHYIDQLHFHSLFQICINRDFCEFVFLYGDIGTLTVTSKFLCNFVIVALRNLLA